MKKLHILLIGATMILASPAMAENTSDLRSNNDNNRATTSSPQQGQVNYADYTANDDDHGDDSFRRVSAPSETADPRDNQRPRR